MGGAALGAAHWAQFAKACAENGVGLLQDAELLLQHERFARALALGVLAQEELGKAIAAMSVVTHGVSPDSSREFAEFRTSHREKLLASALFRWLTVRTDSTSANETIDDFAQAPQESNGAKMGAFYVDMSDARIRRPTEVTATQAREVVGQASQLAECLMPWITAVDVELHAEPLAVLGPQFAEVLTHYVQEHASTPKEQLQLVHAIVRAAMEGRLAEALRLAMETSGPDAQS